MSDIRSLYFDIFGHYILKTMHADQRTRWPGTRQYLYCIEQSAITNPHLLQAPRYKPHSHKKADLLELLEEINHLPDGSAEQPTK